MFTFYFRYIYEFLSKEGHFYLILGALAVAYLAFAMPLYAGYKNRHQFSTKRILLGVYVAIVVVGGSSKSVEIFLASLLFCGVMMGLGLLIPANRPGTPFLIALTPVASIIGILLIVAYVYASKAYPFSFYYDWRDASWKAGTDAFLKRERFSAPESSLMFHDVGEAQIWDAIFRVPGPSGYKATLSRNPGGWKWLFSFENPDTGDHFSVETLTPTPGKDSCEEPNVLPVDERERFYKYYLWDTEAEPWTGEWMPDHEVTRMNQEVEFILLEHSEAILLASKRTRRQGGGKFGGACMGEITGRVATGLRWIFFIIHYNPADGRCDESVPVTWAHRFAEANAGAPPYPVLKNGEKPPIVRIGR